MHLPERTGVLDAVGIQTNDGEIDVAVAVGNLTRDFLLKDSL